MKIEKDSYTIRLTKEASGILNSSKSGLTPTAYLQKIVNNYLFNLTEKESEGIELITRLLKKSDVQNISLLNNMDEKMTELLNQISLLNSKVNEIDSKEQTGKSEIKRFILEKIDHIDSVLRKDSNVSEFKKDFEKFIAAFKTFALNLINNNPALKKRMNGDEINNIERL